MPNYEGLTFTCYLERQKYQESWFRNLCQGLWEHGLDFTVPGRETGDYAQRATWVETLQQPVQTVLRGQRPALAIFPLEQVIAKLGRGASGSLGIRDKALEEIDLFFDLFPLPPEQTLSPLNAQGTVTLKVSGAYSWTNFVPEVPGTAGLILPYQQVWLAFLHWSKLLCSLVNPRYGVGYAIDYEQDESVATKVQNAVGNALEQGDLPDLRTILRGGGCQYIPANRISFGLVDQLLEQPGYAVQRLANGGLFSTPTCFPFHYEHNEIYRQLSLGRKAAERNADQKQIMAHYQRAQGMLERLHEEHISFPSPLDRLAEVNHWEATLIVQGELSRILRKRAADEPEQE